MVGHHWKHLVKMLHILVWHSTKWEWKFCKHVDDENTRKDLHPSQDGWASNVKRCGGRSFLRATKAWYKNLTIRMRQWLLSKATEHTLGWQIWCLVKRSRFNQLDLLLLCVFAFARYGQLLPYSTPNVGLRMCNYLSSNFWVLEI